MTNSKLQNSNSRLGITLYTKNNILSHAFNLHLLHKAYEEIKQFENLNTQI